MHVWHSQYRVHHVQSWTPVELTTQVGDPTTCKTTPRQALHVLIMILHNVLTVERFTILGQILTVAGLWHAWSVCSGEDNLRGGKTFTVSSITNCDVHDSTRIWFHQISSLLLICKTWSHFSFKGKKNKALFKLACQQLSTPWRRKKLQREVHFFVTQKPGTEFYNFSSQHWSFYLLRAHKHGHGQQTWCQLWQHKV